MSYEEVSAQLLPLGLFGALFIVLLGIFGSAFLIQDSEQHLEHVAGLLDSAGALLLAGEILRQVWRALAPFRTVLLVLIGGAAVSTVLALLNVSNVLSAIIANVLVGGTTLLVVVARRSLPPNTSAPPAAPADSHGRFPIFGTLGFGCLLYALAIKARVAL